ncbi:MAG: redoxin domain-containing protein [Alphaproteobacteria bacterium]|nr:redoxin domain-containing protein [Alphaproteobacteria bacterium]
MKRTLAVGLAALILVTGPAFASLKAGVQAPDFTAEGALGGQPFTFHLADALKKGPVVVYFFPAAFTPGCTAEAKLFADAADQFKSAGATLIGVTRGNTNQLVRFSMEACRNKFPVAGISKQTMHAYKESMALSPGWTDRTSYVIDMDGRIVLVYSAMKPNEHVTRTLAAVRALTSAE